jgi:hypothetical protein
VDGRSAMGRIHGRFMSEQDEQKETVEVHICGPSTKECKCNCPASCEHKWDGPTHREPGMSTVTCSRCGEWAISHDMWVGP